MREFLTVAVCLAAVFVFADAPQIVEPVEPKAGPVDAAPPPAPIAESPAVVVEEKQEIIPGPLGPKWDCDEYLLWWLKPQSIPTFLIGARGQVIPLVGQPNAMALIGGELKAQDHSGGRFMGGWALNPDETIGIEFSYFFLGSRSLTQAIASPGGAGDWNLARPYIDPMNGSHQSFPVAVVGGSSGRFEMVASSRVQGAEVNAMTHLLASGECRFDGIIGFRFLQVNEGIRIAQRTNEQWAFPQNIFDQTNLQRISITDIVDQIDGHNIFYGGQIGIRADWNRGPLFIESIGKIAFGQTNEMVKINGLKVVTTDGVSVSGPGGFYAQPTNSGRFTQSVFAILPELTVRTGWQYKSSRWFVGYNFLYQSQLARPADQIDVRLYPPSRAFGVADDRAPTHYPRFKFTQNDFWAQGITLGAELRY